MRKKPNNKMIGFFILLGLGIFIAIIATFVSDKLLSDRKNMVVMYFSESIKGLDVGSPVMFKGVSVGKVIKIDLITDLEEVDFSIPVYVTFNDRNFDSAQPRENKVHVLKELIAKGLRARLNTQNYLTGQLMVELEMFPGTPIVYRERGGDIPEIPTILSPLAELSQGIQDIPLKETFKKVNVFFDALNKKIVPQLETVLNDFSRIPHQTSKIPETLVNFNQAMKNISTAAKSLGNFADYIERHPEALLRGKGGN